VLTINACIQKSGLLAEDVLCFGFFFNLVVLSMLHAKYKCIKVSGL